MNAIPYFDDSLAPFWPSYQNKVIGVLERALREQSGSRIRRILLRLPCEYDNTFNSRTTWFGMDFIETVSVNRPGFPGECFICELRLPDHRFRWKHNKLFLLLPVGYGPAFPAIVDCYTSPPT